MQLSSFLRRFALATSMLAVSAGASLPVAAQGNFPDHAVRVVVGFSAGGTTDVVARVIAKELTELGLPRESTVVAVLREGHVVVPRGDTVLHEGDEVLVLVTGGVEDDVRRALVG